MSISTMRELVEESYTFFSSETEPEHASHTDNPQHGVQEDGLLKIIDKTTGKIYSAKKFTSERHDDADASVTFWLEVEED